MFVNARDIYLNLKKVERALDELGAKEYSGFVNSAIRVLNGDDIEGPEPEEMIEDSRLKPCPFCGGKAYLLDCAPDDADWEEMGVWCRKCGNGFIPYVYDSDVVTKAEAIKQWNRRI